MPLWALEEPAVSRNIYVCMLVCGNRLIVWTFLASRFRHNNFQTRWGIHWIIHIKEPQLHCCCYFYCYQLSAVCVSVMAHCCPIEFYIFIYVYLFVWKYWYLLVAWLPLPCLLICGTFHCVAFYFHLIYFFFCFSWFKCHCLSALKKEICFVVVVVICLAICTFSLSLS